MSGRAGNGRPEPPKKDDAAQPTRPDPPLPDAPPAEGTWGGEGGAGDDQGGPTTSGDGGSEVM